MILISSYLSFLHHLHLLLDFFILFSVDRNHIFFLKKKFQSHEAEARFSNEFSISSIEGGESFVEAKAAYLLSILIQFLFYEMKRKKEAKWNEKNI